jgi:hypothetical protein
MQTFSVVMRWAYEVLAAWYVAAVVGGLMIFAAERLSRREPSESDVKRAADRYRQCYGDAARAAISDHMVAASFAPDTRYGNFPDAWRGAAPTIR